MHFNDGTVKEYLVNVIYERIYAWVDGYRKKNHLLEEFIEHWKDGHAVSRNEMYTNGKNGNKHMRQTTKGWNFSLNGRVGRHPGLH